MQQTKTIGVLGVAFVVVALAGCSVRYQSGLVTHNAAGRDSGDGASLGPVVSADGAKVAFTSEAKNFGLPDTNVWSDVFVRDLVTGAITLISINEAGTNSGNGASRRPVLSPDGSKVAFTSRATNLQGLPVTGDNLYVRDLDAGTTTLVTVGLPGIEPGIMPTDVIGGFSFSPEGTKLAFTSARSDLVAGDGSVEGDVFIRDLTTATTTMLSTDVTGMTSGNSWSYLLDFSPDGTTVMFSSQASNLVASDTNGNVEDLFLRDLAAGTTSILTSGANGRSAHGIFSPDGSQIAFTTEASNLGSTDTNGAVDVYLHDVGTSTSELVSGREDGTDSGNGPSGWPAFSPDGAQIAFESAAANLTDADTDAEQDVFLRTLTTGSTSLVSVNADGTASAIGISRTPSFSPDGTQILFQSLAWDLGPTDTNNDWDLYIRDLAGSVTSLVSASADGTDSGNAESSYPFWFVSNDQIVYESLASNLGPTDTNGTMDIYLAGPYTETVPLSTSTAETVMDSLHQLG